MRTFIITTVALVATFEMPARADEALAAKIGFPKNFDPVATVPKAERLDNDKRIPLKVVRAKGAAGKFVPAKQQPQPKPRGRMAGTSVDQSRRRPGRASASQKGRGAQELRPAGRGQQRGDEREYCLGHAVCRALLAARPLAAEPMPQSHPGQARPKHSRSVEPG